MESYDLNGIVYLCPSSLELSIMKSSIVLSPVSFYLYLALYLYFFLFYLIDLLLALVFYWCVNERWWQHCMLTFFFFFKLQVQHKLADSNSLIKISKQCNTMSTIYKVQEFKEWVNRTVCDIFQKHACHCSNCLLDVKNPVLSHWSPCPSIFKKTLKPKGNTLSLYLLCRALSDGWCCVCSFPMHLCSFFKNSFSCDLNSQEP